MVDVAGDEPLEEIVRAAIAAASSAGQRSSVVVIFLMPIAAADERGFMTHGGAIRAVHSRISASLSQSDEVRDGDAGVSGAHAHRQLVAEMARGRLAHAGHAQVLAQHGGELDVEVVERDDAIEPFCSGDRGPRRRTVVGGTSLGMVWRASMLSRGQAASASVSAVRRSTRQPSRRHSRKNSSPFRYVAMHSTVGGRRPLDILPLYSGIQMTDYQRWYSHRLGRDMGVVVFGHYGPPMIAFPTTGGDEWEYERQGVIGAMAGAIDAGRVKVFCVNTNNGDSFGNDGAHPRHRSFMQAQYDEYIVQEVMPFIRSHCRSHGVGDLDDGGVARRLSRREHAAEASRRGEALLRALGRVRHAALHGRRLRRQLLLQQPRRLHGEPVRRVGAEHLAPAATSISRPAPARGRHPAEAYRLSGILAGRGIRHSLDDWGPQGGHDWPYWRHMMWEYTVNLMSVSVSFRGPAMPRPRQRKTCPSR